VPVVLVVPVVLIAYRVVGSHRYHLLPENACDAVTIYRDALAV
jgi:hypothetical protein